MEKVTGRGTAGPASSDRRTEIAAGVRLATPAGLGLFPMGIAFGLLVLQAGLDWWVAPALSVVVYAGSIELLLVSLVAATTSLPAVALAVLLVNFRHVFYAFSFPLHVVRHPLARAYSVYALTDETYAVTVSTPGPWTAWRLLSLQVALQCFWLGGGLAGVALGQLLTAPVKGLEFALCALFVVLTLDAFRGRDKVPSLVLAAGAYVVALVLAPGSTLVVAMLVFVAALAVRYVVAGRGGRAGGGAGGRTPDAGRTPGAGPTANRPPAGHDRPSTGGEPDA
ncbi:MAG: AzlC family ABC transporter permease [Actinomycetaceae bacterium]